MFLNFLHIETYRQKDKYLFLRAICKVGYFKEKGSRKQNKYVRNKQFARFLHVRPKRSFGLKRS